MANRLEFGPPAPPGTLRAVAMAVFVHVLLAAALTWGIGWKHEPVVVTAEAELWATLPLPAAPPRPAVEHLPTPAPVSPQPPAAEQTRQPDPEIALARERKKKDADKKAEERKRLLLEAQQQAEEEVRNLQKQRDENLRRIAGMANSNGTATGSAAQATGPSSSYAGRIVARVRPNITFTDVISGNPTAEVEVRAAPDGTIVGRKLTKSSGAKSWDDAVLKAIDKTEVLPRDVDGRVPSALVISFRPKD